MKFEYEKPMLEEHDLLIEGSFLDNESSPITDPDNPWTGGGAGNESGNPDIWG